MHRTVHRVFAAWSYLKEEQWLASMSEEGWSLVSVGFLTYVFEKGQPGEYTVRLEMLEDYPSNPKSRAYIEFIEGTGAKYVGSVFRWVYFKKASSTGEFDLFSDNGSRIKHLDRVFSLLALGFLLIVILNLSSVARFGESAFFTIWAVFVVICVLLFGYGLIRTGSERARLKKEMLLFE